jgi:hypothetical protein
MSKKANTFMLRVGTRVNRNVVWTTKNTSYSFLLIRSLNRQNIFDFMLTGAGISLNKTFFGFSNKRLFFLLDCFSYLLFKKFFSRMNIVFSSTAPQKSDAFYISKNISFLNNSVRRLRSDSSLQSLLLKKAENSFFYHQIESPVFGAISCITNSSWAVRSKKRKSKQFCLYFNGIFNKILTE